MRNYEHDKLIDRISKLDRPPDDNIEYARWIASGMHMDLLQDNAEEGEVIIYACGRHSFIHAMAVDESAIDPLDINDLLGWSGDPFSSVASYTWSGGRDDVWIERGSLISDSKTLRASRPLVFGREMPGLPGTIYFEVAQEYSHLTGIHHLPEYSAYCRFDEHGDREHVVTISTQTPLADISLVTFKREPLEEYLAASRSVLVRMFDFMLLRFGEFRRWPDSPEDVIKCNSIFYRQKIDPGKAGYTRGAQIIRPARPDTAIFSAMKHGGRERKQYVEFTAWDFRNQRVSNISTDPQATTSYFETEGNSLPFATSPAFFKPEVLAKYKSDSEKYAIEGDYIRCRGGWTLRHYDVNEAGQIHAYICYLRDIPYSEQLYWKSFNEQPKAGISERAFKTHFKGEPVDPTDPLVRINQILGRWEESDVSWWKLRDPESSRRVTTPLTGSIDEWAQELKNLSTYIIEGFEIKAIRTKLDEMGLTWTDKEKSLALLERILCGAVPIGEVQKLVGLRLVQRVRSKVGAHARGSEAQGIADGAIREHGSYTAHFEDVCRTIEGELEYIEQAFGAAPDKPAKKLRPEDGI